MYVTLLVLAAYFIAPGESKAYPVFGTKRYHRRSNSGLVQSSPLISNSVPYYSTAPQYYEEQPLYVAPTYERSYPSEPYYYHPRNEYLSYGMPTYRGEYKPSPYYYAPGPSYSYYEDREVASNPLDDLHEEILQENERERQRELLPLMGQNGWYDNAQPQSGLSGNFLRNLMAYNRQMNLQNEPQQTQQQPQPAKVQQQQQQQQEPHPQYLHQHDQHPQYEMQRDQSSEYDDYVELHPTDYEYDTQSEVYEPKKYHSTYDNRNDKYQNYDKNIKYQAYDTPQNDKYHTPEKYPNYDTDVNSYHGYDNGNIKYHSYDVDYDKHQNYDNANENYHSYDNANTKYNSYDSANDKYHRYDTDNEKYHSYDSGNDKYGNYDTDFGNDKYQSYDTVNDKYHNYDTVNDKYDHFNDKSDSYHFDFDDENERQLKSLAGTHRKHHSNDHDSYADVYPSWRQTGSSFVQYDADPEYDDGAWINWDRKRSNVQQQNVLEQKENRVPLFNTKKPVTAAALEYIANLKSTFSTKKPTVPIKGKLIGDFLKLNITRSTKPTLSSTTTITTTLKPKGNSSKLSGQKEVVLPRPATAVNHYFLPPSLSILKLTDEIRNIKEQKVQQEQAKNEKKKNSLVNRKTSVYDTIRQLIDMEEQLKKTTALSTKPQKRSNDEEALVRELQSLKRRPV